MPENARTAGPARHARISGVGGYRPRRVVTNEEICRHVDSSDAWIRRRTGIRTRRFAQPDERLEVMAAAAVVKALAAAGVAAGQVGVVVAATMSYLFQAPPLAARTVALLDGFGGAAFDVSAACAGFCHALELARALVASGTTDHVVVVGAERMSDIVDPADRSTAFIFGDGAGAVVVSAAREPGVRPAVWGSDPSGADAIAQPDAWRCGPDGFSLAAAPDGGDHHLRMRGPEVLHWVAGAMPEVAVAALARAGLDLRDLAAFVPHQANLRIVESLATALALPDHVRVAQDIVETGNTSAASIPLALESLLAEGGLSGRPALLMGFGSGLGYCAQVVTLP
jgi:3-oxoacyl-[acyl-carrier-protein] synthase-3